MVIGFIGLGNMAKAIIGGILADELVGAQNVVGSDFYPAAAQAAAEKLGIRTVSSNAEVVQQADIIVFAVKPNVLAGVIEGIRDLDYSDKLFISIATGRSIGWIEEQFEGGAAAGKCSAAPGGGANTTSCGGAAASDSGGAGTACSDSKEDGAKEGKVGASLRLIRFMPNTPALVQAGCTAVCPNVNATQEDLEAALKIAKSFGTAEVVNESLIDTISAVSSCSPAYVFMFIEAMADAGVKGGMPRQQAYRFAAQAVMGSAKLVLETGKHPGELKDMVTSPGGTTIEGLEVLEKDGFRGAVMDAIDAAIQKAKRV